MFGNIYLGELKKLIRPKGLIILAAIIILFLVLYGVTYDFMVQVSKDMETPEQGQEPFDVFGSVYQKQVYTPEIVQTHIAGTKLLIKEAKEAQDNDDILSRLNYDQMYELEGYLKALEYIQENELYGQEIEIYSPNALFQTQLSAQAFLGGFVNTLLSILLIYGVVLGCISYAEEMDSGTLKMIFMRPVTRNKLTTAKLLALFTITGGVFLISILLAHIYGVIRYGASIDTHALLIVFNAQKVFMGTNSLALFIVIFASLIQLLAMVILGFTLGVLIRKKTVSIIIGVIINMGILTTILSLLKIGRFLFISSSNLGIYFGVTSLVPAGGNFFLALGLLIGYLALFLAATYVSFNKRDIA